MAHRGRSSADEDGQSADEMGHHDATALQRATLEDETAHGSQEEDMPDTLDESQAMGDMTEDDDEEEDSTTSHYVMPLTQQPVTTQADGPVASTSATRDGGATASTSTATVPTSTASSFGKITASLLRGAIAVGGKISGHRRVTLAETTQEATQGARDAESSADEEVEMPTTQRESRASGSRTSIGSRRDESRTSRSRTRASDGEDQRYDTAPEDENMRLLLQTTHRGNRRFVGKRRSDPPRHIEGRHRHQAGGDGRRNYIPKSMKSNSRGDIMTSDDESSDPEYIDDTEEETLPRVNIIQLKNEMPIPDFDGRHWVAFKSKFETAARRNRWTTKEKADRLRGALQGETQKFLCKPNAAAWSYHRLYLELEERYGGRKDNADIEEELKALVMKPTQSVLQFADDIDEIICRSDMTPERAQHASLSALLGGMVKYHSRMRYYIKQHDRHETYDTALRWGVKFQKHLPPAAHGTYQNDWGMVANVTSTDSQTNTPLTAEQQQLTKLVAAVRSLNEESDSHAVEDATELCYDSQLEDHPLVAQIREKLENISYLAEREAQEEPINNNVKMPKTRPIPKPRSDNLQTVIECLLERVTAIEHTMEERERNRQAAMRRRDERNSQRRNKNGSYSKGYNSNYNNNNNHYQSNRGGRGGGRGGRSHQDSRDQDSNRNQNNNQNGGWRKGAAQH